MFFKRRPQPRIVVVILTQEEIDRLIGRGASR